MRGLTKIDKHFWLKLLKAPRLIFEYDLTNEHEKELFHQTAEALSKFKSIVIEVNKENGVIQVWSLKQKKRRRI